MDELTVIDQFLDEREFRNYIAALLERCGYIEVHIEDTRTADGRSDNDNDLLVQKEGNTYTVQTYLNREITSCEVTETVQDIDIENADGGILITNTTVSADVKKLAEGKQVEIWDRTVLEDIL
ncbi:MAG: restriction endonuclease [Solobacterium sp.]|nr:restriction endonuclease [Solobacterium sp.]